MTGLFLPYENDLFFAINETHSHFADSFFELYSERIVWLPLALLTIGFIVYKKSWREWLPVLAFLVILFLLCDILSVCLIKPWFARPRPTGYPGIMEYVRTLQESTGGKSYGFVSWHTTNAFGMAMFSSLLFRYRPYTWVIFIWAFVMGYSRIYLGAHFVSDVLGGIVVGCGIALAVYYLYRWAAKKLSQKTNFVKLAVYSPLQMKVLTWAMAGYIVVFALLSPVLSTVIK